MRTNIDIDGGFLADAFPYSVHRSKKALVHEALSVYVATKREERLRATYQERLQGIRRRTEGVCGANEIVRRDRERR